MISDQTFVYYGPEPWASMWRNRHQLLSRLAQANQAIYVEPRPYLAEVLRNPAGAGPTGWRGGLTPLADRLWRYQAPRYAPLGGPPPVRAVTHALRRGHLRRALTSIGAQPPIVWISTPTQIDARFDLPARLRIYHIVDDYLGYHDLTDAQRPIWAQKERALIAWADRVIVVSPELMASKGAGNDKFRLLPNAVDLAPYQGPPPAPSPLAAHLARPILGYVGLISVRLNLELLDAIAVSRPDWTLLLVGTVYRSGCEAVLDRLAGRPNVHLLPPIPAEQVPGLIRSFDLGLAPYRRTRETHHASPLKIYEYLAAGLPVVAADVPGARQFTPHVTLAADLARWIAAIEAGLGENAPHQQAARRAAVQPHTWDARVTQLSTILQEALAQP